MPEKPNIVFIFPDQHRANAMGFINHATITPNLDKLAAQGVVFEHCQTNAPLCMPARASMMSGQYVSKHGCWNNNRGSDADPYGPSHVRSIRDAGYHTAVIGKDHLVHFPIGIKQDERRSWYQNMLNKGWGFDEPLTGHTSQSLTNAFPKMPPKGEPSYPQILEEQGWMKAQREYMIHYFEKCHRGEIMPWEDPPSPVPAKYHLDSYTGQRAIHWIQNYSDNKPFYLQVNFPGPHDPFDSPQEYRDKYRLNDIPSGKLVRPTEPIAPYVRNISNWSNIQSMTEVQYKQGCINYYALITLIDEQVGGIIKALQDKGVADNTWIIYNSDHGEMLGDHFLRHKVVFYEEAVNVPCIIRPPRGINGWHSSALAETVDLSATMIDIAGGKADGGTPGRSLRDKVLLGPENVGAQKGKDYVFSEVNGFCLVRNDRFKLALAVDGELMKIPPMKNTSCRHQNNEIPVEMYDLQEDPHEYKNVVDSPDYARIREQLMQVLTEHLQENLERDRLEKVLTTPSDGTWGLS